jgi:hypothetical protein
VVDAADYSVWRDNLGVVRESLGGGGAAALVQEVLAEPFVAAGTFAAAEERSGPAGRDEFFTSPIDWQFVPAADDLLLVLRRDEGGGATAEDAIGGVGSQRAESVSATSRAFDDLVLPEWSRFRLRGVFFALTCCLQSGFVALEYAAAARAIL